MIHNIVHAYNVNRFFTHLSMSPRRPKRIIMRFIIFFSVVIPDQNSANVLYCNTDEFSAASAEIEEEE